MYLLEKYDMHLKFKIYILFVKINVLLIHSVV